MQRRLEMKDVRVRRSFEECQLRLSLFGLTNLMGHQVGQPDKRALICSTVGEFEPHTQNLNLRIVGQPE
jgi:hypothetical protein